MMKRFLTYLLVFQIIILAAGASLFWQIAWHYIPPLKTSKYILLTIGAILLFLSEGFLALLRLIYHSLFWIKQYTLLISVLLAVEALFQVLITLQSTSQQNLLYTIMLIRITSSILSVLLALIYLRKLYRKTNFTELVDQSDSGKDFPNILNNFIKHSGIMWINTTLKSLTERNFLVPFLTQVIGPEKANIFKVANDAALLFYRTMVKTIGTTDTSLLAYVEQSPERKKFMPIAFTKLTKRVAALCLPLAAIVFLVFLLSNKLFSDEFVFQLFLIITISYLLETILLPYERVLEVKRLYISLAFAYIPYMVIFVAVLIFNIIPLIGLMKAIILIHVVRLVSAFIIFYVARKKYALKFPLYFVLTWSVVLFILSFVCYLIIKRLFF